MRGTPLGGASERERWSPLKANHCTRCSPLKLGKLGTNRIKEHNERFHETWTAIPGGGMLRALPKAKAKKGTKDDMPSPLFLLLCKVCARLKSIFTCVKSRVSENDTDQDG